MDYKDVEILLVEDNPHDAELTLRALKKHNLANKVHVVKDGEEALNFIFASGASAGESCNNLKVILLDLKLPKVSGLEVLQKIKEDEKTRTIPVVCLTSSSKDQDVEACYKLGANSFVTRFHVLEIGRAHV